jgi:transcription antitermination protein NusB
LALDRGATRARQLARELLVKALYQWQLAGHTPAEITEQFAESEEDYALCDRDYFRDMLATILEEVATLDELISRHATRGLEQLDAIGRAILLLGLAELKYRSDLPTKVVINEGVELAKRYGPAESFKFVNAVLDKTARELGRDLKPAEAKA